MPRKSKERQITLGFFGSGEVADREVKATLTDYIAANDDATFTFLVPVTKAHFGDTLAAVLDFAAAEKIPYEVVTDDAASKIKSFGPYIEDAADKHTVARVPNKIVSELSGRAGDRFLVLVWADGDEELDVISSRAMDAGIECLDLTTSMEVIEFSDGAEQEEDDSDEDDDSEAPEAAVSPSEPAEGDEWTPYTLKELETIGEHKDGVAKLRSICEDDFNLEVPTRTRTATMIRMILEAQEAESEEQPAATADADGGEDAIEAAAVRVLEEFVREALDEVKLFVAAAVEALSERLAEVDAKIGQLLELPTSPANAQVSEVSSEDDEPSNGSKSQVTTQRRRRRVV